MPDQAVGSTINHKMTVRYLMYSPTRGVYLGGNVWSKDDTATTKGFAPTYTEEAATTAILAARQGGVMDVEDHECWPDLAGHHASKKAVSDAGLPIW